MDALVVSLPGAAGLRPAPGSRSVAARIISAGLLLAMAVPGCGRERVVHQAGAASESTRHPAQALEAGSGRTDGARLVVATVPPGATIRIDGEVRGVSPDTVEGLVPHIAQIEMERAASQRVSGSLSLEPGLQSLTIVLPPAAEHRSVPCVCTVTTLPDFAFVSVDGGPSHEIVPFEAGLSPGLRHFHVRAHNGRVDTTYTVMVPDGKTHMTIKLDYRARRVVLQ